MKKEHIQFVDPRPVQIIATMDDGTTHQQRYIGVDLSVTLSTMKQLLETNGKKIHSFNISAIKNTNLNAKEEYALVCLDTNWSKKEE